MSGSHSVDVNADGYTTVVTVPIPLTQTYNCKECGGQLEAAATITKITNRSITGVRTLTVIRKVTLQPCQGCVLEELIQRMSTDESIKFDDITTRGSY
jgi:hypothetical protein